MKKVNYLILTLVLTSLSAHAELPVKLRNSGNPYVLSMLLERVISPSKNSNVITNSVALHIAPPGLKYYLEKNPEEVNKRFNFAEGLENAIVQKYREAIKSRELRDRVQPNLSDFFIKEEDSPFIEKPDMENQNTAIQMQSFLNSQGAKLKPDGIWGNNSVAALNKFQKKHGLAPTQTPDGATLKKMDEIADKQLKEPPTAKPPADATLGKMASLFAYEQDGSEEIEGTQGGTTMSCGQRMTPSKCFAAISEEKINEICGSDEPHCYCGMMATVNFPGKPSLQVPIYDTGLTANGGNMIDLNGECFNKRNVVGRDKKVRSDTWWFVSKKQQAGKYNLGGKIKDSI